jgi:hypothetical protein
VLFTTCSHQHHQPTASIMFASVRIECGRVGFAMVV